MRTDDARDITQILQRWRTPDEVAGELLPMVYEELRRLASSRLRQERRGLHAFAGLALDDVAQILGISQSTVWREWKTAQLWLRREMDRADSSHTSAD